jgi:hypothetical protein
MPIIRDRVIKGDGSISVDYIIATHDAYKKYLNRWTFLSDSYIGGYEFYLGKYLEPYYYESKADYEKRLRAVGLDNHVKSVVSIYNSFLLRKEVDRDFGSIESDPQLQYFLDDADLDGRNFTAFMRDVSAHAMVYGHVWVIVDKPTTEVYTRADELNQGIRPYVSLFTPENVLDWQYERQTNGYYQLTYLKVKEEVVNGVQYVREYTPTEISVYKISGDDRKGYLEQTYVNQLGLVPAVCVYNQRSNIRGIGVSAIGDIADVQREIMEFSSEIEQVIRLTNHPSLVKTADVEAAAGAGAIIQMPAGMDPNLKPYLLQPNGSSIDSVLTSIQRKVDSIDRMASLGGIRSIESRRMSGIGLQTEFQLLNAHLSNLAMNLEFAEEQIWRLWARYQGQIWDGEIEYSRTFSIQDKSNDIAMLKMAKDSNIENPGIKAEIDKMIYETLKGETYEGSLEIEEEEESQEDIAELNTSTVMEHPTTTPANRQAHIQEMLMEGLSNDQILSMHPEITLEDIVAAGAAAARDN